MRHKTTARGQAAERFGEDVRVRAEQGTARWSAAQWRALGGCIAEAYAYYERRLVALRQETMDRLIESLERRGLATHRSAGRGSTGRRPAPGGRYPK